jgi:outer membrane lipoprotein
MGLFVIIFLFGCAPVLRPELLQSASIDVPFDDMREHPSLYKGKLYLLGGIIDKTKTSDAGSLIEAVYIPVDSKGYLKGARLSQERFLALWPKSRGLLDPLIYRQKRSITIAGEFIEPRKGKIDEMDYTYAVFEIQDVYLWEEQYYYMPPAYPYPPYPYYYPYWWWEFPRWRYYYGAPFWYWPP